MHGTVPRAREVNREELLVWTERDYRERFLLGDPMPPSWTRLSAPRASATAAPVPARAASSSGGVCAGTGELTGPPVQTHADSFRRGALHLAANRPPRLSVIPVRKRCQPPPETPAYPSHPKVRRTAL